MEALPLELQLPILKQMGSFKNLSALIHASPAFHRVYRSSKLIREEILTAAMIDEFADWDQGVDVVAFAGSLSRKSLVYFFLHGKQLSHPVAYSALCSLRAQILRGEKVLRLEVQQCLHLWHCRLNLRYWSQPAAKARLAVTPASVLGCPLALFR